MMFSAWLKIVYYQRSFNKCVKLCFNNRPHEVWNGMYVGKVVARRAGVILASECLVIL